MIAVALESAQSPKRLFLLRVQCTIAAVLAVTPLLILPALSFHYDVTPKVAVTLIGTAIAILLFLCDTSFSAARRCRADPAGRWFCILAAAQIVALLLSTLFSSHPALSWNGGNWRRLGFVSQSAIVALAFLIIASWSQSGLLILLRATAAAGAAAATYGILQYFGVDPILPSAGYHIGEGAMTIVRPPSTLGHADYFAGYLLYAVFAGAALVALEPKSVWKALGAAAAVAGSAAIALSGTRGALLGLAVGALSLWIWKRPRLTRRHVVLAAVLCAVILAFYFSPAGLLLRARGQWAIEDLRGGARLWLWRDSLRMARQRLFLGFGPESFGPQFPHYQSVQLSSAYPDFYHESPHNIFLDALVSEGLSGLGILVGFSALAYFAARRAVSAGQRAAPYLASALAAGLTAGLFVSFTLTGALYFYGTVAMLAGLAANALNCAATSAKGAARTSERIRNRLAPHSVLRAFIKSHQDALSAGRPGASIPRRGRKKQSVALSLAAVALFLYFGIRLAASDFALGKATRDLNAGRIEESLKAYQWSQSWHPAGSSDDLYFSRALATASRTVPNPALALQASQQAFHAAQRAVQTSEERQNAWYNLAAFYSTQNNANGVEACLRRSVEASPNWFKPHWALAQVLLLSGRRAEAVAEADRAAELDGGKNSEVAKFLQSVHHLSALPGAE